MTPRQRRRIPLVGLALTIAGGVAFLGITAMQGGDVINVPLPGASYTVGAVVTLLAAEFARRLLKKLDEIAEKVERTSGEFEQFRASVEIVLKAYDGRGGLVGDVRELQAVVFRDGGVAPRGVVPPPGFSIAPPSQVTP